MVLDKMRGMDRKRERERERERESIRKLKISESL